MRGESARGGFPESGFDALPGMERARAVLRGLVPRPPLSHLLGLRVTQVGSGTATMTMPASPWLQGPNGRLYYNSLNEAASSIAVLSGAPPGVEPQTTATFVNFFRPAVPESESLIARARVLNSGPTFTHTEASIEDGLGRLVSHATQAAVLRPVDPVSPSAPLLEPIPEPAYATPDPYKRPLPAGVGVVAREALEAQDGLTVLRRVFFEDLPRPPLLELFGGRPVAVEAGKVTLEVPSTQWLCDWRGETTPGVLTDLGGFLAWAALIAASPAGSHIGVSSGSGAIFRTIEPDGRPLIIEGRLADREADMLVGIGTITDASGRRVAIAQVNGLLQPSRRPLAVRTQRMLLTVLFTDLVQSTRKAEQLGDDRWRELLAQHHALVRHDLDACKGREVKTTGDGFLATFENPADCVGCARRIREAIRGLGLEVRVGIHIGQCDVTNGDVAGIAVHLASRVLSIADSGEILVSSTVRDLLLGSEFKFEDRGRHQLKGIEGEWQLFALHG